MFLQGLKLGDVGVVKHRVIVGETNHRRASIYNFTDGSALVCVHSEDGRKVGRFFEVGEAGEAAFLSVSELVLEGETL